MASPSSSSSPPPHKEEDAAPDAAAVCCMCGDHGLPRELVRCKSCRVRLQHSYCSDLYPRATAYTRCNWCLREPPPPAAQGGGAASGYVATETTTKRKVATPPPPPPTSDVVNKERLQHRHAAGLLCSSRTPLAELGAYPVKKKQRKAADNDERTPAVPDGAGVKVGCSTSNAAAGESKTEAELMPAGTKAPRPRTRVKVRRYRLLAEVISC